MGDQASSATGGAHSFLQAQHTYTHARTRGGDDDDDESVKKMATTTGFFGSWIIRGFVGLLNVGSWAGLIALWIASWITTIESAAFTQTFCVWTYIGMLLPHAAAAQLGLMLVFQWGSNYFTAIMVVLLYASATVSDALAMGLYWRIGWNCEVRSGMGSLRGVDLTICRRENGYMIALWVIVSWLAIMAGLSVVGHTLYFYQTAMAGRKSSKSRSRRSSRRSASFAPDKPGPATMLEQGTHIEEIPAPAAGAIPYITLVPGGGGGGIPGEGRFAGKWMGVPLTAAAAPVSNSRAMILRPNPDALVLPLDKRRT